MDSKVSELLLDLAEDCFGWWFEYVWVLSLICYLHVALLQRFSQRHLYGFGAALFWAGSWEDSERFSRGLPRRVLGKVSGQSYEEGDGRFWTKPHTEALALALGNSTWACCGISSPPSTASAWVLVLSLVDVWRWHYQAMFACCFGEGIGVQCCWARGTTKAAPGGRLNSWKKIKIKQSSWMIELNDEFWFRNSCGNAVDDEK